jgi:hypothetical protein
MWLGVVQGQVEHGKVDLWWLMVAVVALLLLARQKDSIRIKFLSGLKLVVDFVVFQTLVV